MPTLTPEERLELFGEPADYKDYHQVSIEQLYHFRCYHCQKWWTIGDWHTLKVSSVTCPHCGHYAEVRHAIQR